MLVLYFVVLREITYGEEGFVIEVESDTTDRVWRYENLFDTGTPADYLREYELVDVDDNRPNIRQPASIEGAKLCREENIDEYVIVFLAEGPGNSPPRPVKAISPETGLRVPRNVGGMAPPCEFTAPGPGLTVEIVTDTEQFNEENNISGDSPPEMPEVEFGSRVVGNNGDTDPSGITFEWTMELSYDEGNYEDFADSVLTLTETRDGDTSWQPDFSELPGNTPVGGHIEVTVNASQGQGQPSLSDTDVRDGYMIRGENPTDTQVFDQFANDGGKAMVETESDGWQFAKTQTEPFNNDKDFTPKPPLIGGDHSIGDYGWGIGQITYDPDQPEVWNWQDNCEEASTRFYQDRRSTTDWEEVEDYYMDQGMGWRWDPRNLSDTYPNYTGDPEDLHNEAAERPIQEIKWLTFYARYNGDVDEFFDDDGSITGLEGLTETNMRHYLENLDDLP